MCHLHSRVGSQEPLIGDSNDDGDGRENVTISRERIRVFSNVVAIIPMYAKFSEMILGDRAQV